MQQHAAAAAAALAPPAPLLPPPGATTTSSGDEALAQLLALHRAAAEADDLGRNSRSCELYERCLALAEATQPRDSLIIAALLEMLAQALISRSIMALHTASGILNAARLGKAAWRSEEGLRALPLSRRCLELLHARAQAGTLLSHTPAERAFYKARHDESVPTGDGAAAPSDVDASVPLGLHVYVDAACDAALCWPPGGGADVQEARLRGVYGALCAVLQHWRGLEGAAASETHLTIFWHTESLHLLQKLLQAALNSGAGGLLWQLRLTCGLAHSDEEALRLLATQLSSMHCTTKDALLQDAKRKKLRSTADVACLGLRGRGVACLRAAGVRRHLAASEDVQGVRPLSRRRLLLRRAPAGGLAAPQAH
jgi:hypothetical protein